MELETLRHGIEDLVKARDLRRVRDSLLELPAPDVSEFLRGLSPEDKTIVFRVLPRELATQTFSYLDPDDQKELLTTLGDERFAVILNEMSPDDRTALLEEFPAPASRKLLDLLSKEERTVALTLLGYPENSVGRLMTPDFVEVQLSWTVSDVLTHIRKHGRESDTLNMLYVVDEEGRLVDSIRLRAILLSSPDKKMEDLLTNQYPSLNSMDDQEVAVQVFKKYDRAVLAVVDSQNHMLGVVTFDDILDVAEEEATEDIQKLGAVEALDEPYIKTPIFELVKKRARWLIVLFVGEMLTATAMGFYESQIQRAVVLALFIPLIISSGGNSGSQAATLIIRALAVGEITVKDWYNVMRREIFAGLMLGTILGIIGFLRIAVWSSFNSIYGPHWFLVGLSVGFSLLGVVMWGTISGSMLPLLLKRLGADPATSSAPFVATLVDVTGLVLYFTIASFLLGGVLL